jgi:hypothetical protein
MKWANQSVPRHFGGNRPCLYFLALPLCSAPAEDGGRLKGLYPILTDIDNLCQFGDYGDYLFSEYERI